MQHFKLIGNLVNSSRILVNSTAISNSCSYFTRYLDNSTPNRRFPCVTTQTSVKLSSLSVPWCAVASSCSRSTVSLRSPACPRHLGRLKGSRVSSPRVLFGWFCSASPALSHDRIYPSTNSPDFKSHLLATHRLRALEKVGVMGAPSYLLSSCRANAKEKKKKNCTSRRGGSRKRHPSPWGASRIG